MDEPRCLPRYKTISASRDAYMTKSGGLDATNSTSTGNEHPGPVYALADVLEREFYELHQADPQKEIRCTLCGDERITQQQQPLADPSLAPASDGFMKHTSIGDPNADRLTELWEKIHNLSGDGRTALCLSGGGVRSAAFNLGVLQGLARLELLNRFHYLSTVSGGGYIGCWLGAWRHRSKNGIADISRGLSWPDRIGNAGVLLRVPDAIRNLRRFTNYLTPATGFLSPDTWASIVIVSRNLILNHIIIVPLIAALLVFAKLVGAVGHEHRLMAIWEWWEQQLQGTRFDGSVAALYLGSFLVPGVFAALGWITLSIARPSWDGRRCSAPERSRKRSAEIWFPRLGIALVLIGAILFGLIVAKGIPQGPARSSWNWDRFAAFPVGGSVGSLVAFTLAVGVAVFKRALCRMPKVAKGVVRFLGYVPKVPPGKVTVPTASFSAIALLAAAAGVAGAAGGLALGAGEELAAHLRTDDPRSTALVLSIAPFWFVISYNAGDAVFLGLTARRPYARQLNWSDRWGDEEREWVARTAGWLTLIALSISILLLVTFFGAYLLHIVASGQLGSLGLAIIGILSAAASIGLAASPFSTHFGTASQKVRLPALKILAVATPIFAGLLVSLLSSAIDQVLFKQPLLELLHTHQGSSTLIDPATALGQTWLLGLCIGLAIFSCVAAFFVNINRFSLYDLYRIRLTREFLGASNPKRRPEVWTGFDETDDIPLADLWPPRTDKERRLYPIINATLNMAATTRLDWQERKAVSFVFTPHYCGSGATPDLGFRDTKAYASGTKLGWAMSISGAAVSPNAGYSTMPGLALLMTLFNLRLGIWAGNPGSAGSKSYRLRGPRFALRPLLSEALARTNDKSKYVYLSDGGHFDNLGLYEMLRRRCRFIVISDATSDPYYVYADLGSVVRKAAIDFGIRITFKHLDMVRGGETTVRGAYSAFAVIDYPEVRSGGRRQRGYLLYVKPYCGGLDEPADVRAYRLANPAFPHDTTFNQFFGEAQFESYRALGSYTMMELGRRAGFAATKQAAKPTNLTEFLKGVRLAFRDRVRQQNDLARDNVSSALRSRPISVSSI
jgi:hypothetical protein